MSAQVMALEMSIETTPAGDVFPALQISQSAIDPAASQMTGNGLLRIRISGQTAPVDVRVTVSTPGLRAATVIDTPLVGEATLRPRLDWDVNALQELTAVRRQILTVTATIQGMQPIKRELEIRVHPLDEALYFVREGNARIDLGWAFAAWVDPQHPVIDELLELAGIRAPDANSPPIERAQRLRQARAIWVALEQRGLRYSDAGAGISQGPTIYSQRVRLLSSTWDERVANCLDGSVLIASALERLGIGSFLVLVPGHAFVGFYTDAEKREAEFLETTLLGFGHPVQRHAEAETQQQIRQRGAAGFDAARKAGRASYRRAAPRLDGHHRPNYALIDISTARAYGIMPLAVGRGAGDSDVPLALSVPTNQRTPISHSP